MRYLSCLVLPLLLAGLSARANDTTAELAAGGIVALQNADVRMEREDLFLSADAVRVDYLFRNTTAADLTATLAFPMPEITGDPYGIVSVPQEGDNFMGFSVTMDGQPVTPRLEQTALAGGQDVSALLREAGLSLNPYDAGAEERLMALPEATRQDWLRRGLIAIDSYDIGQGLEDHPFPTWTLRSAYLWEATFPAGKQVAVSHRYTPAVGGTAGLSFYWDGDFQDPPLSDYVQRYCMDDDFKSAVQKRLARPEQYLTELWLGYVLQTGANWAGGRIGQFTLTVDKGAPDNLVSFCGEGVEKIGPTTFRMVKTDYRPDRDLEILILHGYDSGGE